MLAVFGGGRIIIQKEFYMSMQHEGGELPAISSAKDQRAQEWADAIAANPDGDSDLIALEQGALGGGVDRIHGMEPTIQASRTDRASEGVRTLAEGIDESVMNNTPAIVSRHGRVVGVFYPATISQLVERRIAGDPELAAQLAEAVGHPEGSVDASTLFGAANPETELPKE